MAPTLSLAITFVRMIIGFILLSAGTAKILMNGDRLSRAIRDYELLPTWAAGLLAKWLPWFEVALGTLLIFGIWTRSVAAASAFLLIIFILAVIISLLRGKDIDCGCFGRNAQKVSWRIATRNAMLLILLAIVFVKEGGSATVDAWLGWHFGSTAWLLNFLRLASACLSIGLIVLTGHTWKSKKFGSHLGKV
jgi:uncharacterized membrane protein YphA (DoxX/SURF4 family)